MAISHDTNSLTKVYAQGFFDVVFTKGGKAGAESALEELKDLAKLATDMPAFGEVLSNPAINTEHRARVLSNSLKGRVSDDTLRFLQVLNAKDRISALGGVAASFDKIVQDKMGRVEVAVTTAQPMGAGELEALRGKLAASLQREVVLSAKVEPSMLGGIKVRIGDKLLDGSFASQLRRMKDKLSTEGGATLRARMSSVLQA
jgi:F-type H+-transporting ATPase subunit delta